VAAVPGPAGLDLCVSCTGPQEMGPWAIRREPFERAAAVGMSGSGALVQGLSRVGRLRSPRGGRSKNALCFLTRPR